MSSSISSLSQAGNKKQGGLNKTALVVDDSKLARYVLKEMLLEQGIRVETAESAEEALGTLSAFKPDVIFMDHMMPGMDGFQAVQAIKSDPSTAKIPIMMYTSKDEGVYINQARALGAVGVLPKKLKPVQLESVLQQLKLIPQKEGLSLRSSEVSPDKEHTVNDEIQAHVIASTQHSLDELARSASEDFEKDSMRQLFRQLFVEQRDTIKQDQHSLLQEMVSKVGPAVKALSVRSVFWQKISIGAIVLVFAVFGFIGFEKRSQNDFESMEVALAKQSLLIGELKDSISQSSTQETGSFESGSLVEIRLLEWVLNQNNQVAYHQTLSSEVYRNYLQGLVASLSDQGFKGSLMIKFHEANFCELNTAGVFTLLDGSKSVNQCHPRPEYVIGQSEVFHELDNFIRALDEQYESIDVVAIEMGVQYTLEDYPVPLESVTSAQWNAVAAKNRRLEYEIIP